MIIIQQDSAEVRLDFDDKKTRGTLVCTKEGLGFKIPRGKNAPDLLIPWDKLVQAYEILKNVPGFTIPAPLDVEFEDNSLRLFKDGNQWCCTGPGFDNLQESPVGFGDTVQGAYNRYREQLEPKLAAPELLTDAGI